MKRAFFSKIRKFWNLGITLIVIPHTALPIWRGRVSLSFLLSILVLWTGLVVWAGYVAGRHIDYFITKADNQVMKLKLAYFAKEVSRSREVLRAAESTDHQIRELLGMRNRQSIIETQEGVGGPSMEDGLDLKSLLSSKVRDINLAAIGRGMGKIRRESRERLASFQEITWYVAERRSRFRAIPNTSPVEGRITSGFGWRMSPFSARRSFHHGIDITNAPDTPIRATADGVVRFSGWKGGFGQVLVIDHGYGHSTVYGHCSKNRVKIGDWVKRGEIISYMGLTGRATGIHLHYEVRRWGKPVDPLRYLTVRPEHQTAELLP